MMRRDRDVEDIVTEPPAVRPPAGDDALTEARLNLAHQRVAAEDAEGREPRIVRIGWMVRASAGKPCRPRGQVDLDQIRDVNSRDVRTASLDARNVRLEYELVETHGQLWSFGVLPEQLAID